MVEEETLIFQTAQEDLELYINQHIRKELSTMISVNIPSLITIQNEENLKNLRKSQKSQKISKISKNLKNLKKSQKSQKISKISENLKKSQKSQKISKNLKNFGMFWPGRARLDWAGPGWGQYNNSLK